jgi:hypothetical protein
MDSKKNTISDFLLVKFEDSFVVGRFRLLDVAPRGCKTLLDCSFDLTLRSSIF